MIFTYWAGPDTAIQPAIQAWRQHFPGFRVFTDADVAPLLPPELADLYGTIRLPSARSDIARLLLLRAHGGLYVDAHIGPTAPERLFETFAPIAAYNLILFGKGWELRGPEDFNLMNGVLAARRGAPELDRVIARVSANVLDQRAREAASPDYVPYDIHRVTGTFALVQSFFDLDAAPPRLKAGFADTILVHQMPDNVGSGLKLAAFYSYRRPGHHWSERQSRERFFLGPYEDVTADEPAPEPAPPPPAAPERPSPRARLRTRIDALLRRGGRR